MEINYIKRNMLYEYLEILSFIILKYIIFYV